MNGDNELDECFLLTIDFDHYDENHDYLDAESNQNRTSFEILKYELNENFDNFDANVLDEIDKGIQLAPSNLVPLISANHSFVGDDPLTNIATMVVNTKCEYRPKEISNEDKCLKVRKLSKPSQKLRLSKKKKVMKTRSTLFVQDLLSVPKHNVASGITKFLYGQLV
jgi:hypothetical protein